MGKAKEDIEDYGLSFIESDSPERLEIDFAIGDDNDNYAWVWGDTIEDTIVECNHPVDPEYIDEETVGECPICGATCTWHWEKFEEDGIKGETRVVDQWTEPKEIGGLIEEYIKENYGSK